MRYAVSFSILAAALALGGCATRTDSADDGKEIESKQYVTGSRLPYKDRNAGAGSVQTSGRSGMADTMNGNQMPHRQPMEKTGM